MTFYEFDYWRLSIIFIITTLSFKWVLNIKNRRIKIWYVLLALFLFIYSGIGGSIEEVPSDYTTYYIIYVVTLGFSLFLFSKKRIKRDNAQQDTTILYYIDKYGSQIVLCYILFLLFDLAYPVQKLQLLINPPTPSLEGLHYSTFVEKESKDVITNTIYLIRNFLQPFFYLSLYKYRKNIIIVILLLLIPVYIDLCSRGIVGRGQMLLPLLIAFFSVYEILPPSKKKILVIGTLTLVPFVSYLLVQFSFMRIGASFRILSFGECMQILLGQEIAYPLHFSSYINSQETYIESYFLWLILLPFPGFMKFGYGDPQINLHFTQLVSGLDPSDMGFSICLPGIVGESLFVFGPNLFPIHAIIMAFIISKLSNYLSTQTSFRFLYYYVMLVFSYYINRGGTSSSYSFAFKQFIILIIVIAFIRNLRKPKRIVTK